MRWWVSWTGWLSGSRGGFVRSEPRARMREYVSGLVSGLERKNGWTLAERAGEVSPDGMQRLLRRADWDSTDPQLDAKVRDVVGLYLHPPENAVVVCVDEKSQCQALERRQPILPMRPGIPSGRPTTTPGTA